VPIGSIKRARAKKLKEALNELVQNIWNKMDLEGLGTFKEQEGLFNDFPNLGRKVIKSATKEEIYFLICPS
jgi:hypothetical protein